MNGLEISPFKELFTSLDPVMQGSRILRADNEGTKIEGKGDVKTNKGTLENVFYEPGLAQNLFSISAAHSRGRQRKHYVLRRK